MKKLALVLALVLLCTAAPLSALADTAREDYVIDYMIPGVKDHTSTDDLVGQYIYDRFGIIFNIIGYAGDWTEKCSLMLAAGDYPDMLQLQGNDMFKQYVAADALLNVGELAEQYAPNFLTRHAASIPYWKMVTGDGNIWKWEANTPNMQCATGPMFDVLIRSDILEQQNWPEVLTTDSYVELLKKGMEANPETNGEATVGMTFAASEEWMINCITQSFDKATYTEVAGNGSVIWNSDKEIYEDMIEHPSFRDGMKFFNDLYQAGALDEECFTDGSAETTQKLKSGRALATWYVTWEQRGANSSLRSMGMEDKEYVVMPVMTNAQVEGKEKRMIRILDTYDWQSVVITKNAKDPQRLMELLDWVCSEEGQVMLGWGLEGVHYTLDESGKRVLTPELIEAINNDPEGDFLKSVGQYYFLGLSADYDPNGQIYNYSFDTSVTGLDMSDRVKEVYSHYGWETVVDPWQKNKNFEFDYMHTGLVGTVALDQDSAEKKLEAKLCDYRTKHVAKLMTAESNEDFEATWNQFIEGYRAMNPQSVVDAYNTAYAAVKTNFEQFA